MTCRPSVAALSPHPASAGWGRSWMVQALKTSIQFGVPCVGCFPMKPPMGDGLPPCNNPDIEAEGRHAHL